MTRGMKISVAVVLAALALAGAPAVADQATGYSFAIGGAAALSPYEYVAEAGSTLTAEFGFELAGAKVILVASLESRDGNLDPYSHLILAEEFMETAGHLRIPVTVAENLAGNIFVVQAMFISESGATYLSPAMHVKVVTAPRIG